MTKLSNVSEMRLNTCEDELIQICHRLANETDFIVTCGHRGKEDQEEAFNSGASKVHFPNSRHNSYPSEAVDIVPYWKDEPHVRWGSKLEYEKYSNIKKEFSSFKDYENAVILSFDILANKFLEISKKLGIEIEWGGTCFKTLVDRPHFQLKEDKYA